MDRDSLQRQIKPFSPQKDDKPLRLFQHLKPSESDVPPLDTICDQRARSPHGLQGNELRTFWSEIFRAENLTLADLYPERLQAAWRIVREWCALIRIIQYPNQALHQVLTDREPSPWTFRNFRPKSIGGIRDAYVRGCYGDVPGLPLSPPVQPKVARHHPDYEPNRDKRLVVWCKVVARIGVGRLGLMTRPDGRYGMAGLVEPIYARLAFPSPGEIYAFEEAIVTKALGWLVETSLQEAGERLTEVYGLRAHEVQQVLAMAQDCATRHTAVSSESAKAVLLLRLEKLLGDAQKALAVRDAVFVVREIAKLRGLVKVSGEKAEQSVDEMVKLAAEQSGSKEQKRLPPPPKL
jgi:hypothetical protein